MSRLKQLSNDSLIYGFGGAVGKGISFFLLPIYTRVFTPADYGNIEMMSIVVSLLTAFLSLGLDSAQSFYFFEQRSNGKEAQKTLITSIFQWRIFWGVAIVILATLGAPLINAFFFGSKLALSGFAISFSGAFFGVIMNQSMEIFRLKYKAWIFMILTVGNTVLASGLVLIFVLIFHQGIIGFFLGSAVSGLIIGSIGWILAREYLDLSGLKTKWWPRLIRFGLPLLPAELGFFAMNTSDRWFVRHFHGEDALGIFSVGAKFALLLAFVIDMFRKAWWPVAMDSMHSDDGPETFRTIARLYMGVGVAAIVYLTYLSPFLVNALTSVSFHSSYGIVGVMAWQSLFYGFYMIGSAGIWKAQKTYLTSVLMGVTGLLNVLLNFLWVPQYGGMGAALANSISYFVWILVSMIISEKYWPIKLPIKMLLFQIIIGSLAVFYLNSNLHSAFTAAVFTHVVVIILLLSAINNKTQKMILNKIQKLYNK